MENLLQVGVITTTHGVRGEVKVFPTTDDAARFKKIKTGNLRHRKRTPCIGNCRGKVLQKYGNTQV